MDILEEIVKHKHQEVEHASKLIPLSELKQNQLYQRRGVSLAKALQSKHVPIIAEFKRRSPSKSVINHTISITQVANTYQELGMAGMSVLTDQHFFGGSLDDLIQARASFNRAILRKDFMISTYQIHEAKAYGADVILLIAAILDESELVEMTNLAQSIGLEVLVEVHSQADLDKTKHLKPELIGINNRNLKTFDVDIDHSIRLAHQLPKHQIRISESGISKPKTIQRLRAEHFNGFLIGEEFMKQSPEQFTQHLSSFIKRITHETL